MSTTATDAPVIATVIILSMDSDIHGTIVREHTNLDEAMADADAMNRKPVDGNLYAVDIAA